MPLRSTSAKFGAVAKLFHWAMALMIIGMLALGLYMHELSFSPEKFKLYGWHKSFGMTILVLALLRLGWRAIDVKPDHLPSMPADHVKLANAAHWALYGLMLSMPLSGWLMTSATGTPIDMFGTGILVPSLIGADEDALTLLKIIHDFLGKLLMAVAVIHIGAALKHQFLDKDATLRRMLPWGRV
jgi:cytochrome b561